MCLSTDYLKIPAQHIDEGLLVAWIRQEVASSPLVCHIFCGTLLVTIKDDNCSTILPCHILTIHVTDLPICWESSRPRYPIEGVRHHPGHIVHTSPFGPATSEKKGRWIRVCKSADPYLSFAKSIDPPKFLFKSETTTTSENRSVKVQR